MDEKSILIVEDDEAVRRSLYLFLKHKGHRVECAEDGLSGLNCVKQNDYGVVITDVMMPNMNGVQLLEMIKQIRPLTEVIMVSGYNDLQLAIDAMKKGAADFITKPFRYEQVERIICDLQSRQVGSADRAVDRAATVDSRLERKIHELSIMYSINEVLDNIANIEELFKNLVDLSLKITEGLRSVFYLYDHEHDTYYLRCMKSKDEIDRPKMDKLDPHIAERLSVNPGSMILDTPDEIAFYHLAAGPHPDVQSVLLAPFYVRGQNFGILAVENKLNERGFTESDVTFVNMLLKKASLVIENRALYETIYLNLVNTLRSLVSTIEAKDKYTQRHSERVTKIALLIARELRCAKEELDVIQFAGMLHDIGKIGVSDAILQKPSSLTKEEYETIKQHPIVGARILEPLGMLPHEKAIIRHHHERWDGKGYPDGLAGRDIPFLARIVSLADAYDAMTSDRVYRKGLTHEMAVTELEVNSWRQFDSAIVDAFKSLCARMGEQVKLELE